VRIGVFGGTFNPVHIGHIRGAISVYEAFALDRVLFMPTGIPPHKKDDVAPADYRYEMLLLAVEGLDNFYVSKMEIDSNRVNYTIDTINELKREYQDDEMFFVVGTDAFFYLELWKDYEQLIDMVSFILMRRPEYNVSRIIAKYKNTIKFINVDNRFEGEAQRKHTYIYTPPAFDISSSMVRSKIKNKETIRYLVPEKVENFIKEKGLYKI